MATMVAGDHLVAQIQLKKNRTRSDPDVYGI